MARCSCGNAACSCVIKAAPNGGAVVVGSGTPERPYLIGLTTGGNPIDNLLVVDTPTLDLTLSGAGTAQDKKRLSGSVTVEMQDLTDVSKTDVPVTGDVIQWNGTQWVFAPPGATTVPVSSTFGTAPLAIYGTDSTIGQETYLDSNGAIRVLPRVIPQSVKVAADPISGYPLGDSVMTLTNASAAAGGWPLSVSGTVTTHHRYENGATANVGYQVWTRNSATPMMLMRNSLGGVWSPWFFAGGQAPAYSARKSAAQTMASANAWYTCTVDAVELNEGGITYAGGVFTVPVAGKYQVEWTAHMQNTTSSTTVRQSLVVNGAEKLQTVYSAVGANKSWHLSRTVKMAAGDSLYLRAQCSTSNCNMYGSGTGYTTVDVTLVGG